MIDQEKCVIYYYSYPTEIGEVTISCDGHAVTGLRFGSSEINGRHARTPLSDRTAEELNEYLAGKRKNFDVPLGVRGTDFQQRVWNALCEIPYGETRSYSEIAEAVGNPKAVRAVGMANHSNPVAVIVPCHRVIGKNGSLTGYAGGKDIKEKLLALERTFK